MNPETSRHDNQLLSAVLQIQSDVALIKAQQKETSHRLFGNGQPGLIDRLDGRMKALELRDAREDGEKRSNRKWAAAIASAVSALVSWGFEALAHRK